MNPDNGSSDCDDSGSDYESEISDDISEDQQSCDDLSFCIR